MKALVTFSFLAAVWLYVVVRLVGSLRTGSVRVVRLYWPNRTWQRDANPIRFWLLIVEMGVIGLILTWELADQVWQFSQPFLP